MHKKGRYVFGGTEVNCCSKKMSTQWDRRPVPGKTDDEVAAQVLTNIPASEFHEVSLPRLT
jgi:hypothetical protein